MVYGISIISAMFVLTFSFIIIITLPGNENNLTEWKEGISLECCRGEFPLIQLLLF